MQPQVIGILYNLPACESNPFFKSAQDILTQSAAVQKALFAAGYDPVLLPFAGDVSELLRLIESAQIDLIFNLCESVAENPRLAGHPAALLELLGLPFTGSTSMALALTTDKVLTKRLLLSSNLTTPDFRVYDGPGRFTLSGLRFPVILKPNFEDASVGIEQESIVQNEAAFSCLAEKLFHQHGTLCVEEYIDGREFNVSLLGDNELAVLPIAEIDFSAFPATLYPIVGYRAKWDEQSFEYHHTPRIFPDDLTAELTAEVGRVALECFRLFSLRDYARVDLRVDRHGRVNVLEVNANPCLSPDAGFAAAAEAAGIGYQELILQLVRFASRRVKGN